jgi:hypothetical protein
MVPSALMAKAPAKAAPTVIANLVGELVADTFPTLTSRLPSTIAALNFAGVTTGAKEMPMFAGVLLPAAL